MGLNRSRGELVETQSSAETLSTDWLDLGKILLTLPKSQRRRPGIVKLLIRPALLRHGSLDRVRGILNLVPLQTPHVGISHLNLGAKSPTCVTMPLKHGLSQRGTALTRCWALT